MIKLVLALSVLWHVSTLGAFQKPVHGLTIVAHVQITRKFITEMGLEYRVVKRPIGNDADNVICSRTASSKFNWGKNPERFRLANGVSVAKYLKRPWENWLFADAKTDFKPVSVAVAGIFDGNFNHDLLRLGQRRVPGQSP